MSLFTSWLASPPPDAAVEITPARVSAATAGSRAGSLAIQAYAVAALPPQAITPSLTSRNIADPPAVTAALRFVFERMGSRPSRVALIIPDLAARVSVVRFEHIPARRDDLDQLVRWQVRKAAPFPIEDASIAYTPGNRNVEGGTEFIVVMARRDVVKEYEDVCAAAGADPGLVDIATFSVVNLALASSRAREGDWLVVHMRPEYTSIAIARAGDMIFFRNKPEGDEETLADVVHQTAMYYQDRLAGQRFARVMLGGSGRTPGAVEDARRSLEERLATPVESFDPASVAALSDRVSITPDLVDILTPLTGMLLRTRVEAVTA